MAITMSLQSSTARETNFNINTERVQVKIWFQNRRTKWKKQDGVSNAEAAELKTNGEKSQSSKGGKSSKASKSSPAAAPACLQPNRPPLQLNGPPPGFADVPAKAEPGSPAANPEPPAPLLAAAHSPPLIAKAGDVLRSDISPPVVVPVAPVMTPPPSVVENGGLDSDSRASDVFCWGRSSSPSSVAGGDSSSVDNADSHHHHHHHHLQPPPHHHQPCYSSGNVLDAAVNTSSYQEREMRAAVKTIAVAEAATAQLSASDAEIASTNSH